VDNPLLIGPCKASGGKCLYLIFVIVLGFSVDGCESGSNGDNQRCRLYATQYLSGGEGITNGYPNISTPITVNCVFDASSLSLTCSAHYTDQYGSYALITKNRGYASVSDFVEETSIMGKTLATSYKFSNDGFAPDSIIHELYGDGVNSFDSGKILLSTDNLRFKSWDQQGRPTESDPTGICTGDNGIRFEYNDQERTAVMHSNTRTSTLPGDGTVPCIPITTLIKFDSHRNVVLLTLPSGTTSYSIVKTEAVCVNE
jgi:hypothetical protein